MDILFPIADVYLNLFVVLAIGFAGGLLSGMLGLGGGIFITPSLLLMGVPSFVAITTQLINSMGTNLVGFISHWRRKDVDVPLGIYIFLGGITGAATEYMILRLVYSGANPFAIIRIISGLSLFILGIVMVTQSVRGLLQQSPKDRFVSMRYWMIYFPWHRVFLRTRAEISVLIPFLVGFFTGLLTSSLGGGANMLIVPILTYLIGRTSPAVAGTSLMAAFFINLAAAFLHGMGSAPCDALLLFYLFVASCIGSQIGRHIAAIASRQYIGIIGGMLVFLMSLKFFAELYKIGGKKKSTTFGKGVSNYLNELQSAFDGTTPWLNKVIINYALDDPTKYALTLFLGVITFAVIFEFFSNRSSR